VLAVYTGADLVAAKLGPIPCMSPVKNVDGTAMTVPPRLALQTEVVRFAGDPVALIVAETLAQAKDAAERVDIQYEPLVALGDIPATIDTKAPRIWDFAAGNVAFHWATGNEAKTNEAFAKAARVIGLDLINNRVVPSSMEPRNAIADYASSDQRLTLHTASQGGMGLRKVLAGHVFKIAESKLRIVTADVGGGFGMKIFCYPEYVGVLFAARDLGRPVKWTGERGEAFLSDTHGRDHRTRAELAVDASGRFLGLRVRTRANIGAYASHYGPFIPTQAGSAMLAGVYTTPAIHVDVTGFYTNTAPIDAYRGAGRPEANFVVERLVDHAARALGLSPAELRRRNFIPPQAMPFKTALETTYDSGEFERNMTDALKASRWDGFAARRVESERRGKLRGIGLATYIEACGGGPDETVQIRFDAFGSVTLLIGNQSNGQGHETAYAQIAADRLGVPFESIRVLQGDTDLFPYAGFTGGSRALSVGGGATVGAAERIIAKGRAFAAHAMETAESDIEFKDGNFTVVGTDKRMSIIDVAKLSFQLAKLPKGMAPGLDETAGYQPGGSTYPNGCHVAEIEIDPATGTVRIADYTIVDDFGNVINPLLLAGQVHGGTVQGIGQALYEGCVYDPGSGQLLTGSFMDYCLPRADDVPSFSFAYNVVPCRNNTLGVKGSGEAGAIGAPPAVINAVVDALAPLGIQHVDMPATPQKIWALIQSARRTAA
jgi:carbon-monoxide dehydrogenase large subunit